MSHHLMEQVRGSVINHLIGLQSSRKFLHQPQQFFRCLHHIRCRHFLVYYFVLPEIHPNRFPTSRGCPNYVIIEIVPNVIYVVFRESHSSFHCFEDFFAGFGDASSFRNQHIFGSNPFSETQLIDFPELVVVGSVCDDADFGASLEQQFKDLREFINQFDFVLKCFVVQLEIATLPHRLSGCLAPRMPLRCGKYASFSCL